jgi:hypothetical protein
VKCCPCQRSPTGGPRENFGGSWKNLDNICNFYVYYTVSLYSDSSSCHRHRIADNFRLIALHQIKFYDHYFIDVCTFLKKINVSGPRDSKL